MTFSNNNPFSTPDRVTDSTSTLCPWENDEHSSYYASIDGVESAIEAFSASNIKHTEHLSLAYGPNGSGKTSLINKCAYELKKELENENYNVKIINLNQDNNPCSPAKDTVSEMWTILADRLVLDNYFNSTEQTKIEARADNPGKGLPYISRLLGAQNKKVIIPPAKPGACFCEPLEVALRTA